MNPQTAMNETTFTVELTNDEMAWLIKVVERGQPSFYISLDTKLRTVWADKYRELERATVTEKAHDLFKNGDENIPNSICDIHGDIVLDLCKVCHKGESELDDSPSCETVLPEDLYFGPEPAVRGVK